MSELEPEIGPEVKIIRIVDRNGRFLDCMSREQWDAERPFREVWRSHMEKIAARLDDLIEEAK